MLSLFMKRMVAFVFILEFRGRYFDSFSYTFQWKSKLNHTLGLHHINNYWKLFSIETKKNSQCTLNKLNSKVNNKIRRKNNSDHFAFVN